MTNSQALLVAALLVPLGMLSACLSGRLRERISSLLWLAPIPALAATLLATKDTILILPDALLGLTLALDMPGAMLLGAAALLWIAAGAYQHAYARAKSDDGRFTVWWLTTLAGNIGVFIAADMVSFYLFFTLVSLAAYGLVAHDDTPAARRAAAIYVAFALLGEALLIMGFVLLAAASPDGSLFIREAVAALPDSPWRNATLAFLVLGFGAKIALVPLHVWMPLTYRATPIPAAAVLSGAAVKAGVIGLIRFLPFETALPGWGEVLAAAGVLSAYYGVAIGITQANPRTVLAYSSVSQLGLLAAVLGMGLAAGDPSVPVAVAFAATHHVLVKGGLFLAIGVVAFGGSRDLWKVMLPAAMIALGLGGLPLTGGALAKLVVKAPLGEGVIGTLATLAAIGSTLLMLHFLRCLMRSASRDVGATAPTGLVAPWLVIAFASVALPWTLYPLVDNASWSDAFGWKAFWDALWPVLLGGLLFVGLQRAAQYVPRVPKGDILAAATGAVHATRRLGVVMERMDKHLRQWPVAGVLFLALTVILGAAVSFGY